MAQLEDFDEDEIKRTFDVKGVGAGGNKKLSTIVLQKKRLLEGLGARLDREDKVKSESESESRLDALADFLRTSGDLTVGGVAFLGGFG